MLKSSRLNQLENQFRTTGGPWRSSWAALAWKIASGLSGVQEKEGGKSDTVPERVGHVGADRRGTRPRSLEPPLKWSATLQLGTLQRGDTHPYSQRRGGGSKGKLHVPLGRARRPLPKPRNRQKEEAKAASPGRRRREQEAATGSHREPSQTQTPHRRAAKAFSHSAPTAGAKRSLAASEEGSGRHTDLSQKPDSPQSWRLKITG